MSSLDIRKLDAAKDTLEGNMDIRIDGVSIKHVKLLQLLIENEGTPFALIAFEPTHLSVQADVILDLKAFIARYEESGGKLVFESEVGLPTNDRNKNAEANN